MPNFGDPAQLQIGIRWVDDCEPPERRPVAHGWSMGQLIIHVAGVNVTATKLDEVRQAHVGWYLAPFLDWLATNWMALLHEERLPWPNPGNAPAAVACNRALDEWIAADDPPGMQHYADVQEWYFRHGVRNAAAGGIFPDLFLRRVADHVELSWSGAPMEFTRDGLHFESDAGVALLPVSVVAKTTWDALQWAVVNPPARLVGYRDRIAELGAKVDSLVHMEHAAPVVYQVPAKVLKKARLALSNLDGLAMLECPVAPVNGYPPFIAQLPPTVAMFGGVSPDLGQRDVDYLCDRIVAAQGGSDSRELAQLVADRHGRSLHVPHQDGRRFAEELIEDMALLPTDTVDFVDVRRTCSHLAVAIEETELETDSIRGVALAGEGFSPRIVVNKKHYFNQNESGKRFTVAHELCHVLFDRTRARRITHASGPWAAPGIEQRANAFAAYLLMPRALVLLHARRSGHVDVKSLSGWLKVNESALIRHLCNLGFIDEATTERLLVEPQGPLALPSQ